MNLEYKMIIERLDKIIELLQEKRVSPEALLKQAEALGIIKPRVTEEGIIYKVPQS